MQNSERREHVRLALASLPGRLVTARDRREIDCNAIDVSARGLGILTTENLLPELEVILLTEKACIYLSMVHCHISSKGHQTVYQYGFKTIDVQINLVELCRELNCLKEPTAA